MSGEQAIEIKIGVVHINVTQMERAVFFYEEGLGFKKISANEQETVLGTRNGQPLLVLHKVNNPVPRKRTTGLYHFAVLLPSREDLAKMILHMVNQGVDIDGASDHGVSEALYLTGPEDVGIELYADREMEAWPLNEHGRLDMLTQALDLDDLMFSIQGKNKTWDGLPAATRVGHVHLRVAELTNTAAFYKALGLSLTQEYGGSALFFAGENYHHHIGANTWQSAGAEALPPDTAGLRSFEILVTEAGALEGIKQSLNRAGIPYQEAGEALAVSDPNGIRMHVKAA